MKLLALRCPVCEHPLTPGEDDLVILCPECRSAIHIGDDGLSRINIQYAAPAAGAGVTQWQPFWIFQGQVTILKRTTQSGGSQKEAAQKMWGQPRHFYVPAWDVSLRKAQEIGSRMIELQHSYQAIAQPADVQLTSVVLSAEDATKLLEFIILAIEARRSDWLTDFQFTLDLGQPKLWALPTYQDQIVAVSQ